MLPERPKIVFPADFVARYELKSQLGAGAMGRVVLAHDRTTDRAVAIKIQIEAGNPELLQRLLREGRAMARVRHPNVVAVYDMVEVDGRACLVTEYLEQGSLADRLTERRLPPSEAVRIAIDCLEGLQACHAAGIVHRDLKPDNILMDAEDRPRIADFGLAHTTYEARMTQSGALLGTPRYWAPEQASAQAVSPRSDVYAMGAILHEMLAGKPPFTATSLDLLVAQQVAAAPPPLEAEGIAAPIAIAVRHALEKDPQLRPESAGGFANELREALRAAANPRRTARTKQMRAPEEQRTLPAGAGAEGGARRTAIAAGLIALLLAAGFALAPREAPRPAPVTSPSPVISPTSSPASRPVDLTELARRVLVLEEAANAYASAVQPLVRRRLSEGDRHAGLKQVSARGERLAADLAEAHRQVPEAEDAGSLAIALDAALTLARFDCDMARRQVAVALERVPWNAKDTLAIEIAMLDIKIELRPAELARHANVLERAGRLIAKGPEPGAEVAPSRFAGVAYVRSAGWVLRRFHDHRVNGPAIARTAEAIAARVEREVPPPLGRRLAEAVRAANAYTLARDEEAGANRYATALKALIAAAAPGTAHELERERAAISGAAPAGR